jgi:hypothetical protein
MIKTMFDDWWPIVLRTDNERLADLRAPLTNLNDVAIGLGLDPLPPIEFDPDRIPQSLPAEPKFKNLTRDVLPCLRHKLIAGEDIALVDTWAERLMRYCEIKRPDLKKTVYRKWPVRIEARLCMLQVSAFLLDYYYHVHDLRFLNTALKLSEMRWIVDQRRISRGLRSTNQDEFVVAAFGVRVLLMRERALRELDR